MEPHRPDIILKYPMRLSYIVAILAWLNTFALIWAIVFDLTPDNNKWVNAAALMLFIVVSLIASNIQAQNK